MYRDVAIRAYDEEIIKKIDELRENGVNITELLLKAIKEYQLNEIRELVSIPQ